MRVGLIGGIGSGKSLLARALERRGAEVIDADRIGHRLLDDPEVKQALVDHWGREVLQDDGRIDRKAVGRRVFADPQELKFLNRTVHPRLVVEVRRRLDELDGPDVPMVVIDAALLIEFGLDELCDRVIFVDAPRESRAARVREHRGWSARELELRESSQISLTEKRRRADMVIENHTTPDHVEHQVERLWSALSDPGTR
ncbi:MAG: dephospho-CoA kinase [Planctomycetota bacterium]